MLRNAWQAQSEENHNQELPSPHTTQQQIAPLNDTNKLRSKISYFMSIPIHSIGNFRLVYSSVDRAARGYRRVRELVYRLLWMQLMRTPKITVQILAYD